MKKSVKLIILLSTLFILLTLSIFIYSCSKREDILKIGNFSEYIYKDEENGTTMLDMFKKYYKEKTGRDLLIEYTDTFTSAEEEYTKAMSTDLDVICSSDYIIQKMIANNEAIKLNTKYLIDTKGNKIHDFRDSISPMMYERFDFDKNFEYSVPFMWGTLGISFNQYNLEQLALQTNDPTLLEDENKDGIYDIMQFWSGLWDSRLKNKVMMKRAPRDAFVIASIKYHSDIYRKKHNNMSIDDFLKIPDEERVNIIKNAINPKDFKNALKITKKELLKQTEVSSGLEADEGKTMIQENNKNLIAMSQWGGDGYYSIFAERNVPRAVNYSIPVFGSNLFCDAWVIPKNAKNLRAANLFINYLAMPENAMLNMDYIGYSSAISGNENVEETAPNGIGIMKDYISTTYQDQIDLYEENIQKLENKQIKAHEVEGLSKTLNVKKLENGKLIDLNYKYEPIKKVDLSYFFYSKKSKNKKIELLVDTRQLPSLETIERCFPMRSEGKENGYELIKMWIEFIAEQK